ncbi:CSMD [Mytilus coruscus]|uniref:CSMD n=1 Tax=Mytilus coruscus TaxID=42192 RepID=A0A6J8BEJ6_MYTCO|nr:CSMD [Mytilus coruscus]
MAYTVIFVVLLLFHCTVVFGTVSFVMVPFATNSNDNVKVSIEVQTNDSTSAPSISVKIGQRTVTTNTEQAVYEFGKHAGEYLIPGNVTQSAVYIKIEDDTIQHNLVSLRLTIDDLEPLTIYPTESLGKEYRVITYCQILGSCFIALATVPNTNGTVHVNVFLPRNKSMEVQYHNASYSEGKHIQIQLSDNEALLLECKKCDFTGTLIKSSEKIALFAGGSETIIRRGDVESTFLAQMTPVHTWGKDFILVDSNIDDMGDMIRIIARYDETVVKIDGQITTRISLPEHYIQRALNRGDIIHVTANKPIMICQILTTGSKQGLMLNVPPTEQYFEDKFNTHCRYNGFAIISGDEDVTINSEPIIIGHSGYIAIKMDSSSCSSSNSGYKHGTFFGQRDHPIRPYIKEVQYFSKPFLREVFVNKTMVPGDKADNDNDGQIDEDDCGFYLSSVKANFETAITECEKLNKSLAIIDTMERYLMAKEFLRDKGVSEKFAYIGLKRQDVSYGSSVFQLLDSTSFNLSLWDSGQPEGSECVLFKFDNAKLHDAPCTENRHFLCTDWIRDDNDDCPPEIYGEKDNHGLNFVFPVWQLDDDTQFQVDIFGDANGEIIRYSNGIFSENTKLEGNHDLSNSTGVQPVMQVIRLKSYSEVSASLIMWTSTGVKGISTLLYPVDMWGLEYHAASYCPINCTSYCVITSAYNNTNVKIVFKSVNFTVTITKEDDLFTATNKLSINLKIKEYTYAKIESDEDLTGTYIKADNPISVICGSTFENSAVVEHIFPVQYYQNRLFTNVFQLYTDTIYKYIVRIMGSEQFTLCEVRLKGTENFIHLFFLKTAGDFYELNKDSYENVESISCNLPVFVWSVIFEGDDKGMMIIIPSTELTADMYKWNVSIHDDAIGTSNGMKLSEQEVCTLHNLEDPDCDGLTKEEICTVKGYNFIPDKYLLQNNTFLPDYDLDGNYDEDCAFTLPECYKPIIANGSAESKKTYVTSKATDLSCHTSFSPATTVDEMTCYANGSWAPEFTCLRDCSDPKDDYANSRFVHKNSTAVGSTVIMGCIDGYSMKGENNITCLENSTLELNKFKCLADCGDPRNDYNNSTILANSSWAVDSTIEMNCQEGFALVGEKTLKCNENSTWTQNAFSCKEDCGDPRNDYNNSTILANSSWAVDSTIEMNCQEGFALVGEKTLKCNENSTWTQNAFSCKEGCVDPSAFVNNSALYDPSKAREHGSSHIMICMNGYSVKGNALMICLNDSTWTPPKFSCVEGCNDPRLSTEHSYIEDYEDGTPFLPGMTIIMKCKRHATKIGIGKMTCLNNKQWTRNISCIKDCPDPRNFFSIPRATVRGFTDESSTAYGVTYEFRCRLFYTLYGDGRIECLKNSSWSSVNISCKTCKCPCRKRGNPRYDNVTKETYKQIDDETKAELQVDKKATAVSFRRKNSASDERQEAKNIGVVGIVILSVVLGALVMADLLSLKAYIQNYLRRASER